MSIFRTFETDCPACGVNGRYEVVYSVNADRRPDLRDAILTDSFQVQTCSSCGETFRMEPSFTYVHLKERQFLTVWPSSRLPEWRELERKSDEAFAKFYGATQAPAAAQLGQELAARTVFGWQAAREKIVAAAAKLDDVTLELAKIAMLRWNDEVEPDDATELRLLAVMPDRTLVFGTFQTGTEQITAQIEAPADLLTEIEADAESWKPLRTLLTEGSFVDMQRLEMEAEPA